MPIPSDETSGVTLSEWVDEVRHHLDGNQPDTYNTLAAAWTAGGGSMTFTQALGNIGPGTVLSMGENTLLVLAANPTARTVTVVPAWGSSVDTDAEPGTVVRINPRFTDHRIVKALNAALPALSANGLYRIGTETFGYVDDVQGYPLEIPDLLRVLEVRRQTCGSTLSWPRVRAGKWRLVQDAPTADFPAGQAIRLLEGEPGFSVQVVYAAEFETLTGLSTLVTESGVPVTALDVPPLGAAINLMAGREVARNNPGSQGDTRRADEVGAGAVGRSYGGLVGQYRTRLDEEARRLRARYGPAR